MSLTCKALGGKAAAFGGLSLVEDAARRLFECASDRERSCLPKRGDEGWIELCYHLLMLRSKLTFDRLVGSTFTTATTDRTPGFPAGCRAPPCAAIT